MTHAPSLPQLRSKLLRRVLSLAQLEPPRALIENFETAVEPGEVVALVGPSGAGKSTLLRIIAGLETQYSGTVSLGDFDVTKATRRIYLMPQAHTLLPWRNVQRNLQFNTEVPDSAALARKLLNQFGLGTKGHDYPRDLSGGERAAVALMCAMCAAPEVLLLDEPFKGLDQLAKERCVDCLVDWLRQTETEESVILVSHDIPDAVYLADRVLVVRSRPLAIHEVFESGGAKERRSPHLVDLENRVTKSLAEAVALAS